MDKNFLKKCVYKYWNATPCESQNSEKKKYSLEYFNEIEKQRYLDDPDIMQFAQFSLFKNKKILEVGVGIGTDFIQFVRAGSESYGIDLTPQSVDFTKKRLELYKLNAKEVRVADAEKIPYDDNLFDLVYSYGVIHHSPDTKKAFEEIIRVTKPGGMCKIMIYNKHSLAGFYLWIVYGLLKGRLNMSLYDVIFEHLENYGTKSYTKKEIAKLLYKYPCENIKMKIKLNTHHKFCRLNTMIFLLNKIIKSLPRGENLGLQLQIQFKKKLD